MVSHFREREFLRQNPIFDVLYCEEECLHEDSSFGFGLGEHEIEDFNVRHENLSIFRDVHDLFWDDDELLSLLAKEKRQDRLSYSEIISDESLGMMRNEAMKWISKVIFRYKFTAATSVLAANYYDRFITRPFFRKDKPWMSHLVAVSCLSIAAKMEEIRAPLLIDLQSVESKYFLEAKTIQRMELLVLSTLHWEMNPVTPFLYIDHIIRRLGFMIDKQREFWRRCETVILSTATDLRVLCHLPSVIAASTMLFAIRETESGQALDFQNQFITVLKINREDIEECCKVIRELMEDHGKIGLKRKLEILPTSLTNYMWVVSSSSPDNLFKRNRVCLSG